MTLPTSTDESPPGFIPDALPRNLQVAYDAVRDKIPDAEAAETWMQQRRWPDGIVCVHCTSPDVVRAGDLAYTCQTCRYQFSVRTCDLIAHSQAPTLAWARTLLLYEQTQGTVADADLVVLMGTSPPTASNMLNRIKRHRGAPFLDPNSVPAQPGHEYGQAKYTIKKCTLVVAGHRTRGWVLTADTGREFGRGTDKDNLIEAYQRHKSLARPENAHWKARRRYKKAYTVRKRCEQQGEHPDEHMA